VGGGFSLGFGAGAFVSGEGVEGLDGGGAGEFGDVVGSGLGEGEQGVDGAGGGGLAAQAMSWRSGMPTVSAISVGERLEWR
jgi:hypothetical protein